MLVGHRRFEPLLHQSLTGPGNRVDGGIQRTGNLAVTPALAGLGDTAFSGCAPSSADVHGVCRYGSEC